jgi:uncharacterized protein with HEPN domain
MTSAKAPSVRLQHIIENIDGILASTSGMASDEVANNFLVLRAVERCIQIISEAAKELPVEMRERERDVPWREIIGIGNLLRHEYYRIRAGDLLSILHVQLPQLRPAIVRLMTSETE